MKFDKNQFKAIRIFHDKEARDFEYVAYALDTKDYLIRTRAIYNQVTDEDIYLVDWLRNHGVEPAALNFEEFLGKHSKSSQFFENAEPHEIEFIKTINEARRKIEEKKFKEQYEFAKTHSQIELKSDYIFDKSLGLFIKTPYNTYETKQFNSELGALITLSIQGTDNLHLIQHWYQFFKEFMFSHKNKLIEALYNLYKVYKEDVYAGEPDEIRNSVCPEIEEKHHVLNLIKFKFLELIIEEEEDFCIVLSGEATWDEEHGFTFLINEKGEIQTQ